MQHPPFTLVPSLSLNDSWYIVKEDFKTLYVYFFIFLHNLRTFPLISQLRSCHCNETRLTSVLKSFGLLCSKCAVPQKILKTISKVTYWFDHPICCKFTVERPTERKVRKGKYFVFFYETLTSKFVICELEKCLGRNRRPGGER